MSLRGLSGYVRIHEGDYVVMCSDGVGDNVPEALIKELVVSWHGAGCTPQGMAEKLAARAARGPKLDDISVIVARVERIRT